MREQISQAGQVLDGHTQDVGGQLQNPNLDLGVGVIDGSGVLRLVGRLGYQTQRLHGCGRAGRNKSGHGQAPLRTAEGSNGSGGERKGMKGGGQCEERDIADKVGGLGKAGEYGCFCQMDTLLR